MGGKRRAAATVAPEQILAGHAPGVIALANRLRRMIAGMIDGVTEAGLPGWRVIALRRRGHFAFIQPMADHVRVGFEHGRSLPDLAGLLEGDGTQVRYVSV